MKNLEQQIKSSLVNFFRQGSDMQIDYLDALHNAIDEIIVAFVLNRKLFAELDSFASESKEETVCLTQTEINAGINALENTSRIINYLNQDLLASDNRDLAWGPDFMENKDIRNLRNDVDEAWQILSQAQDNHLYKEEREKSK